MDIEILVQEFCDYSVSIKGFARKTIQRYKHVLRYYSRFAHVTRLDEVNHENVRSLFYYGRIERKWTTNTFLHYHKTLKVFFRWCIKQRYLQYDPLAEIEVPKLEKRLPSKLTKQESLRLLEITYNFPYEYKFLRYRNHAIFSMFIFAGLRKQELLRLTLVDVDIENRSIFIKQGKGNKDRVIPISHTLAQILQRYLQERKRLNKTCPEFFTSLNRNLGFTESGLKRLVSQMNTASGLTFGVHKLRHTFATLMLEGGCDIYSLSKMMGHSDIKTTTIYLYASVEHLRTQITRHPLNLPS
jgi:site-specific recombinase XerD